MGGRTCRQPSTGVGIRRMTIGTRDLALAAREGITVAEFASALPSTLCGHPMRLGVFPSRHMGICGMALGA
jgi:hypothetical protein